MNNQFILDNSSGCRLFEDNFHWVCAPEYVSTSSYRADHIRTPVHFNTLGHLVVSITDDTRWDKPLDKFWCVMHPDDRDRGAITNWSLKCDYFCDKELAYQFASLCPKCKLYSCSFNKQGYLQKRHKYLDKWK